MSDDCQGAPSQDDVGAPLTCDQMPTAASGKPMHWVSARMATPSTPLIPTPAMDPAPETPHDPDIAAKLAALHEMLASAMETAAAAPIAGTDAADPPRAPRIPALPAALDSAEHSREPEAEMPKFLRDDAPEPEGAQRPRPASRTPLPPPLPPLPPLSPLPPRYGAARLAALRQNEDAPWIFLASIFGVAALFLAFQSFHATSPQPKEVAAALPPAVEPPSPETRLSFVREQACERPPCDALSTSIVRTIATMPIEPAEAASPGLVYATSSATLGDDPKNLDSLDVVTIKGLPPEVRLSVGHKTSDTEWTLAAGDLTDIGMVVPSKIETFNTTIEIKKRDGEPLAVLGLTIQRETPEEEATPPAADPAALVPPLAEAAPGISLPEANDSASENRQPEPREKPVKTTSPVRTKPAKVMKARYRTPRMKTMPPPVQASMEAPPKPPATLLEGFLKSATEPAAPPEKSAPPDTVAHDKNVKPAPTTASDRPPGFETLENLGGGFGLQQMP